MQCYTHMILFFYYYYYYFKVMCMCDVRNSPLYAVNVLLPLVNKETALAYGREKYSKAGNPRRDRGGNKAGSGRYHEAAKGDRCWKLTGKPQPSGDAQIKRNGLIYGVKS